MSLVLNLQKAIESGAGAEEILRILDDDSGGVEDAQKEAAPGSSLVERFFRFANGGGNVEKSPIKREGGIDFPANDYAYVPDPSKPSTWKLRLTETPGKVTISQLGRAAAAFSPGGYRGNKVQLPSTVVAAVKRRIRAEYKKLGVSDDKIPMSLKSAEGNFFVWKQADGRYRWFAVYSNNFRDEDYPPEIISEKSHRTFIEMVDKEIVGYPELWHWHIPGTKWGQADWLDYAHGFAVASGTVDEGHEKEAEALASLGEIGVSHGMPVQFILRDSVDSSVITLHVTKEISPLPLDAAANKLTGFHIFKGDGMGFTDEKRAWLLNLGVPEATVKELEAGLALTSKAATEAGIQSKEIAADATQDETPPADTTTQAAEPVAEVAATETDAAEQYIKRSELGGVLAELLGIVKEQSVTTNAALAELSAEVKSLRATDEEKVKAAAKQTPVLSLAELIGMTPFSDKEAKIDGRSGLAKSKPAQTVPPTPRVTGVSFIDHMLEPAAQEG